MHPKFRSKAARRWPLLALRLRRRLPPRRLSRRRACPARSRPCRPTPRPRRHRQGNVPENVIIVTARRREESSQEVPLAISVLDGRHDRRHRRFNVGKLQQLAPTLQVYSSNPRNTAVNIRGIGVPFGLTNDGFEQGVGIYVDDVYYSRVASATFDFLDVAQIEVLRGPQGTLYGKNTTAGAINITTNQPTFDFEGSAEVSLGNLGFKQAKAAVSGPLSRHVAARLAVSATTRRGTIYNVTSGNWINEQDNLGVRGQMLWQAQRRPRRHARRRLQHAGPGMLRHRVRPLRRRPSAPLNRQYRGARRRRRAMPSPALNPFDRLTDLDASLNAGNKIGGASLRAVWDVGPGTLTSVTAWRFWDWKPENDRDFTGLPIVSEVAKPVAAGPVHARNSATTTRATRSTSWSARSASSSGSTPRAPSSRAPPPAAGTSTGNALANDPAHPRTA